MASTFYQEIIETDLNKLYTKYTINIIYLVMGNNICASSRKCEDNTEMFGMLCKRPYEKPVVVKFEKKDTFYKKRQSRRRRSRFRRIDVNQSFIVSIDLTLQFEKIEILL